LARAFGLPLSELLREDLTGYAQDPEAEP